MLSLILLVIAAGAAIGGGVHVLKKNEGGTAKGREWVEESVEAWRANELDPDQFEVHHEDLELNDLFKAFDHDVGDPYLSPDGIEERLTRMTGSSIPKNIVDSTELALLRAWEAAKIAKSKREAEAVDKSGGELSTKELAAARALAGKDLLVQGGKAAGRGAVRLGRGAVSAGITAVEALRARRNNSSNRQPERQDDAALKRKKATPKRNTASPANPPAQPKGTRTEPNKSTQGTSAHSAPQHSTPRAPKPTAWPSASSAEHWPPSDVPAPEPRKWPNGAPKLEPGNGMDRASA